MTRRWDIRVGAVLIIVATVVLSFASLYELAFLSGFGVLAWFWPVCLDAVAYVATRLWLDKGQAWRGARALALAAIGLSVGANGLVHALSPGTVLPGIPVVIVIAVGSVPPVMLALVIHVLVSAGTGHQTGTAAVPAPAVQPVPGEPAGPVPVSVTVPSSTVQHRPETSGNDRVEPVQPAPVPPAEPVRVPVRTGPEQPKHAKPRPLPRPAGPSDAELLDQLAELVARTGTRPSVGATRTALGVGTGRANRLLGLLGELDRPAVPVRDAVPDAPGQTGLHLVPVSTGTTDQ